jgi:PAS domain S-box-containing protein
MPTPLRVLIIEDVPSDAKLTVLRLEEEGFDADWQQVQTEQDFLAALATRPDLILADWRLPHFSGLRALKLMTERGLDIPFIIVSGSIGEEAAVDALRQGADDYVMKDRPARLGQAVRHALEDRQMRQERKRMEREFQALSARNEAILASVPDIIMEVDNNKVYTWANRAGVEFFGEDVIGKEAAFYFEGEQQTYNIVQPLFNGSENIIYVESWQRRRDGKKCLLAWWCRVLKDAEGNVRGAISTARDITERKQAEEALKASEEKYRSLFENVPDGVYRTTPDGVILAANPALAAMLGFASQEELLKTRIEYLYLEPGDRKEAEGQFQAGDVIRNVEIRLKRKDGAPLVALDNAHAVRDEQGEIIYYEGTLTDITALKEAEAKMEHQADELGQRYAELSLLYDAGLALNRELDPRQQLETLFKIAMQALQADGAEFFHHDAATGVLRLEIGVGHYERLQDPASSLDFSIIDERGLVGWVGKNRVPFNSPDVLSDPRWVVIDSEIRSALWVPVESEGQLLGVIGVLGTRLNAFDEQDEHLLLLFANQAAVALENARLFAETNRRLRHFQALRTIDMAISNSLDLKITFDIFLEQVTQQLGVHAADILLLDLHTQSLEYAAARGFRAGAFQQRPIRLGEGLAGRAALERRTVHIPDLPTDQDGDWRSLQLKNEGFTAYYGAPLIAKGQLKGVLEVFQRGPFTPGQDWFGFLEILAGEAAIAIDNVALFNDLQRSNVELTLAYDATIEGWSRLLDLRGRATEGHTQLVADLTLHLARAMNVKEAELIHIRRGALLHDIGTMGIPDAILYKPGPLDETEMMLVRQHTANAYEILAPIHYLRPAVDISYYHHERWDGSGYPHGLRGEQIPLSARIMAVVDVYDALTSERPYRKAWSRRAALEYIQKQAGRHFDPQVVSAFLELPGLRE